MFNKVKFVINKILLQNSKNKKGFNKIKEYNKNSFNSTSIITRKFSSHSNSKPPNNNLLLILITVSCGFLFSLKKNKK